MRRQASLLPARTGTSPGPHEFMRKVYPVADDELLYQPMPGITWNKPLDGETDEGCLPSRLW